MHVHAAQHVALPDHLQVVHHRVVALLRGLQRVAPERGRMGAGGQDREAVLGGNRRQGLAQARAIRRARPARLACGDVDDLDLRLQEFAG